MAAGGILIAGAVIMDAVFGFRREERKPKPTAGVQLQPFVAPSERGAGLALAGIF